ncbi:hypothetical protein BV20DRAFT_698895 [Pilatotrama ljubarskyi]|nr:hypothetical protein BV20DRAFT_698895 [Pilatotrama ljubarskyi]
MKSEAELEVSIMLVRILLECRARIIAAPDVSDEHRHALCARMAEVLGGFQTALRNLDGDILTTLSRPDFGMLLHHLTVEHSRDPTRPLVRSEFVSAVEECLGRVRLRPDFRDLILRSHIRLWESALEELKSEVQKYAPVADVVGTFMYVPEQSISLSTAHEPDRSTSLVRLWVSSSPTSGPACVLQSPLAPPLLRENAVEGGSVNLSLPAERHDDPAYISIQSSSPSPPAASD